MDTRPIIGVTIGDPAGIGPEIVARALANPSLHGQARLLAVGTASMLAKALEVTGVEMEVHTIQSPSEGAFTPGILDVVDPADLDAETLRPGAVQPEAGRAAFEYFRKAIEMAMAGEIDAIATAPLNKEAMRAAGVPYLDHTETLAKLTASPDPMTMFAVRNLRVFFLTRHVSLVEACRQVTAGNLLRYLQRVDGELRRLGMSTPRVAVAGLNPHAGEGGIFGTEEVSEIAPAIAEARRLGINALGPIAADSVFFLALQGNYDAVLSLYHDQGHIATKTLDFERTVSVTLGIPFVRTSVDHGTAFDIAWKGIASPVSMEEAIRVAAEYAVLLRP